MARRRRRAHGTFVAPGRVPRRQFVEPWQAGSRTKAASRRHWAAVAGRSTRTCCPSWGAALLELRASEPEGLYAELLRSGGIGSCRVRSQVIATGISLLAEPSLRWTDAWTTPVASGTSIRTSTRDPTPLT